MIKPNFSKQNGLIPAIIQDYRNNKVLMLGYMNEESYNMTLKTGKVTYFSRSRNKLWVKGETSGNIQKVKEIFIDCDVDTLLIKVEQVGGSACHKGYESCFYRKYNGNDYEVIEERVFNPDDIYGKK